MIFLSRRFSTFAEQAEWVSQRILNQHNTYPASMRDAIMQYLNYRESMAYKLLAFEKETRSWGGWLKSFIPGTNAFHARSEISNQLLDAKHLYLKISINYYNHVRQFQKSKNNLAQKNLIQKELKKDLHKPTINTQPIFKRKLPEERISPTFSMWKRF